jgi:hypothetical protein
MASESKALLATGAAEVREIDRRIRDGIDVGLLWHPQTNRVSVAVTDGHAESSFEFDVDPGDALAAFHHPAPTRTTSSPLKLSPHERDERRERRREKRS